MQPQTRPSSARIGAVRASGSSCRHGTSSARAGCAAADQNVVPNRYGASRIASKRSASATRKRCIGSDHTDADSARTWPR